MEEAKQVHIYMGADHAGYQVKNDLQKFLEESGFHATDLGVFTDDPADYPDIAREVSEKVVSVPESFGILVCGSGVGVCIAANKMKGARAAYANNEELAESARVHNDANILTVGARNTDFELIKKIALKFLNSKFEANTERRVRRVNKLNAL